MPIRCDLCNVITDGNPNHETGKRHKELKASRDKSSEVISQKVSDCHPGPSVSEPNCHISPDCQPSPAVVQPVFCDLCNVSSSDQLSQESHLHGKKHTKMLNRALLENKKLLESRYLLESQVESKLVKLADRINEVENRVLRIEYWQGTGKKKAKKAKKVEKQEVTEEEDFRQRIEKLGTKIMANGITKIKTGSVIQKDNTATETDESDQMVKKGAEGAKINDLEDRLSSAQGWAEEEDRQCNKDRVVDEVSLEELDAWEAWEKSVYTYYNNSNQ